ncbi:hypothetical protein D9Q98_009694 [Chlorella vulgaris]|uniref:DNA alkylation repair enzyme n=1 Tax=Chlorella vulgaris TaxID=3077 RepID=A0A9D4YSD4_CHLVU|nr:hypothetical protein D9Q98_009694 [Chlorella vulgaris]
MASGTAGPSPTAAATEWVAAVQELLDAAADPGVKASYDAYFKNVILHRGVRMPGVDAACKAFLSAPDVAAAQPAALQELGMALLRQPLQEDKQAGVTLWKHALLCKGGRAEQWRQELQALQQLYNEGHVFAWSTCDSICGRLLAPLIKQLLKVKAHEGQACAQEVLGWCRQDNLWLRRSSVVAFVTLAKLPDDKVFPGFQAALLDSLALTVRGSERFAQTGTGWVLRELGKGHEAALLRFVDANLAQFSREGLRYALEHQPASVRQRLMAEHKERQAQGQEQEEQGGLQEEPQPEEEEVQEPGQVAPEKRRQRRQPKGGDEQAAAGQRSAGTTKRRKRRE